MRRRIAADHEAKAGRKMPTQKPGLSKQKELLNHAQERFWSNVHRRGVDECWLWISGTCVGYGYFYVGGGRASQFSVYAHRAALYFASGVWDRVARHSCDTPRCCNPAHLVWGSHAQNSQDALRRGRAYIGEANSNAKLTDSIVRDIRVLRAAGLLQRDIAARLPGISAATVSRVCLRKGWSHV